MLHPRDPEELIRCKSNRWCLEVLYAAELEKAKKDLIIRRSWKAILIARSDREFSPNCFTAGLIKCDILKQDRLYRRVEPVSDRGDGKFGKV